MSPVFIMRFLMKYHFKKTMPKRVDLSYRIFMLTGIRRGLDIL